MPFTSIGLPEPDTSDSWNAETDHARATQWRREAGTHAQGKERDACLAIAAGYSHLAALIDMDLFQP